MAAAMGVAVEWERYMPEGWKGAYDLASNAVYLLWGLSPLTGKCVLAHELGHAHYRHSGNSRPNEWHADRWAAHQLIDKRDYFEAIRDSPSLDELSRRLNVTPHTASVYVRTLRGPGMFMEFQPVKLEMHTPTYQEVCALAA
ncbi:peptidase [Arthrobacter phage Mufasa8]|uniref:Peptidase n=1 Tax=Arthrobacter phage Mufasa8 TaxID=2656526 RepID=A0A649VM53_9CAUD|nr:metallo-protease [Arthrobacter phage Mufasa8]QGJ93486.1 peptidase [Arthrobacter phage Mufasa8]